MFNQSLNPRSVTFNIILINILFYLVYNVYANQYTNPELHGQITAACALFYPASHWFKPLQIVTHMFMHANFWHIFGNMFGLFMFGAVLEKVWGPQRFMIFYFVTGLGAALLYMAVQALIVYNFTGSVHPAASQVQEFVRLQQIYNVPVLGASGAIFGILVAFGMLFPNSEIMLLIFPIPIKAKYFVSGYFLYELYSGIANNPGDEVAHFAHVGGALFGFILVRIWNRNRDYLY
jgi:membrane associated rhomboid family serine protease